MNDFLYDNILGSDFELMPCRFDSSGGIETVDMGSQMSNSFVKIVGTDEQIIVNKESTLPPYPSAFKYAKGIAAKALKK